MLFLKKRRKLATWPVLKHSWSSGMISACHAGDPGSIPGGCKLDYFPHGVAVTSDALTVEPRVRLPVGELFN